MPEVRYSKTLAKMNEVGIFSTSINYLIFFSCSKETDFCPNKV